MISIRAQCFAFAIVIPAFGSVRSLPAQIEVGNWERRSTASMPSMTMTIEPCCSGGRRLIYHVVISGAVTLLTVESGLDGRDAPVLMNGKPSGETMAITRVDPHHATAVLKMNGNLFGTAKATLSADGRTLTVVNDYSSSVGGQAVGKYTEIWLRK